MTLVVVGLAHPQGRPSEGPALWCPEGQVPAVAAGHWRQEGLAQRAG